MSKLEEIPLKNILEIKKNQNLFFSLKELS